MRIAFLLLTALPAGVWAQLPQYVDTLPVDPPYYRVRYAGSETPGELIYASGFRVWIPPGVETLRGVVVHQHGDGV